MGQITNTFKTVIFIALLTALVLWVGNAIAGTTGFIIALVFVLLLNGLMFWFSSKIVLWMYGAKELPKTHKVSKMISEVASLAGLPSPKAFIIESATPNAFATGRGYNNSVVAVTTGITNLLTEEELRGVIAHEVAHIKNRDMLITTIAAVLAGIISYIANMAQWAAIFGGNEEDNGNWIQLLLIALITPIIAMFIQLAISRAREYVADETGARIVKNPKGLASALKKLENANKAHPFDHGEGNSATSSLFIVNPFRGHWWLEILSTHPPMEKRIAKLEALKL